MMLVVHLDRNISDRFTGRQYTCKSTRVSHERDISTYFVTRVTWNCRQEMQPFLTLDRYYFIADMKESNLSLKPIPYLLSMKVYVALKPLDWRDDVTP